MLFTKLKFKCIPKYDIGMEKAMKENKDKKPDMSKTAVALSYDPSTNNAPQVVASGKGYLAEKIINKAKEEAVPVHEDKKLASSLSTLQVGDVIPPELYSVVADILLFVDDMDKLKRKLDSSKNQF